MQRIVQISLNRNPWSIEVDAHARLELYLSESAAALAGDPDRDEILLDLEQAIVDQCKRRMPVHATVISLAELTPALNEIGPVRPSQTAQGSPAGATASASAHATSNTTTSTSPPLQQVSQGAWVSGVCLGLAQHLRLDVLLVRVVALALLVFSGGAAIMVYGVLMLLIPFAPLDPEQSEPQAIPAKLREWIELLRSKLAKHA